MLAALLASTAVAPARAQVNLEDYLREDGYQSIKISPDGEYYAATVKLENRGGIAILRRSDRKLVGGATGASWQRHDPARTSQSRRCARTAKGVASTSRSI